MNGKKSTAGESETVRAAKVAGQIDADGFPESALWKNAPAIRFAHNWQGRNADPERETEARLMWSNHALFIKFLARYRNITVFDDGEPNGRRDQLWDRDVAEVFLQPRGWVGGHYKEFEVSPNGLWIDLDIALGEKKDLKSGLKRRVTTDEASRTWNAELMLPMKALTSTFDPSAEWRVNFYRVEGATEPRFYSAWRPTGTPQPNFHVPESFGKLIFEI